MRKILLNKIIIFSTICFLIILAPAGFTKPSEFNTNAIVTAMGIDYDNDMFELSAQIIVPQSNTENKQKYQQLSSKAKTLYECRELIEMQIGKILGIAHCYTIIIGNNACIKQNLLKTLDGYMRGNELGTNAILIHTDNTAKEILNVSSQEEDTQSLLTNIIEYNQKQLYSKRSDLFSFYNNTLSPHSTAIIPSLSLQESDTKLLTSSDNTNNKNNKKITNNGEVCIFVNGNYITKLNFDKVRGFNWMDKHISNRIFKLDNVNTDIFTNATLVFTEPTQKVKYKADFIDNIPTLYIDITAIVRIMYIKDDKLITLNNHDNYIDDDLQSIFNQYVKDSIQQSLIVSKETNFDGLNFFHEFEKANYNQWQQYLNSLENPRDYMKNINVISTAKLQEQSQ